MEDLNSLSLKNTSHNESEYCANKSGTSYEKCEHCKQKEKQNVAEAFCVQCQDFLCARCSEYHILSRPTRHHRILPRNEMPSRKAMTSAAELCSVHDGATCNFYCQTHENLICQICKLTFHAKCSNVYNLCELSGDTIKSENYKKTRVELRQNLHLFRALKAQLLQKFHSTRDNIEMRSQELHRVDMEIVDDEENFINSQAECVKNLHEALTKMNTSLQSCDLEIDLAETLDSDMNILEKTEQHVQLFLACKRAEQTIKHMKSVHEDATKHTNMDAVSKQCIQDPQAVQTVFYLHISADFLLLYYLWSDFTF